MKLLPATLLAAITLSLGTTSGGAADAPAVGPLIGYTTLQTDLPGGRHPNVSTMRATVVRPDGTGRKAVGEGLTAEPGFWSQFAGWSPDGTLAVIGRGWESVENARWEEEHKEFRFNAEGWLYDTLLVDLETDRAQNLTAVDRASFYNTGLFFWPGDPNTLGFQALVDGNSHPFRMDRDGRNKRDLTSESKEFAYGFSASPDGKKVAYHKSYQIFIADADGANARRVETGRPFNFGPLWSPDGARLLFLAGERYDSHPYIVNPDGAGLHKLIDRGGYRGFIAFLDVPDFHNGSSDVPAWAVDGRSVFVTAKVGDRVDLFRVALDGQAERLTQGEGAAHHYHPTPSPDGEWLAYGGLRDGVRHLYVRRHSDGAERRLTDHPRGRAAMWPHWRPTPTDDANAPRPRHGNRSPSR